MAFSVYNAFQVIFSNNVQLFSLAAPAKGFFNLKCHQSCQILKVNLNNKEMLNVIYSK